jgi:tetratricopeptide (TPR) repeat protein
MFGLLTDRLADWDYLLTSPLLLAMTAFQVWMLIHAIRQREWIWVLFIAIGWGLSALFYYFMVYRATPSSTQGFELPGAGHLKRIKELQAQIHHLDKAHHHSQLGDVYFQQGKLDKAEASYRAALERDPQDLDTRAHFGQCLLRLNRPAEARPLLEGVLTEKPEHDYGYTMMAQAETLMALGEIDNAILYWQHVTQNHSYPRAKVQLAELYLVKNQPDLARAEVKDVVSDDAHAPAFQRRRDRTWIRRAKSLASKLG